MNEEPRMYRMNSKVQAQGWAIRCDLSQSSRSGRSNVSSYVLHALSRGLVLAGLCCLLTSCKQGFEVSLRTCQLESDERREGAVLPYSKRGVDESVRKDYPGPFIEVLFSTREDLEALGRHTHIDSLGYSVFACSSVDLDTSLFIGDVYRATAADEEEKLPGVKVAAGENLYKIYLPNSLRLIAKYAERYPVQNVPGEMEKVRSSGLCLEILGGNMLGGGIRSNPLRIPVTVVGEALELQKKTGVQ